MLCGGGAWRAPQVAPGQHSTARRNTGTRGANGAAPVEIAGPSWALSAAGDLAAQSL